MALPLAVVWNAEVEQRWKDQVWNLSSKHVRFERSIRFWNIGDNWIYACGLERDGLEIHI